MILSYFKSLFISAFVDIKIGIRKVPMSTINSNRASTIQKVVLSYRTLASNSQLNCKLNSTPTQLPTSTSTPYWPLSTAYINWGRGLDNFWLHPRIMIAWTTDIAYIFLKKFQILTGTKNEFGTPAVFCPDKYY